MKTQPAHGVNEVRKKLVKEKGVAHLHFAAGCEEPLLKDRAEKSLWIPSRRTRALFTQLRRRERKSAREGMPKH
ncbi:hypothetical protein AOLI_G00068250 [Acnodon oligacanthus]